MKRMLSLFLAMCLLTACNAPVKLPERTDHVYTMTDADSGHGEYLPVFGFGQLGVERIVCGSLSYLLEYHNEGISLRMESAEAEPVVIPDARSLFTDPPDSLCDIEVDGEGRVLLLAPDRILVLNGDLSVQTEISCPAPACVLMKKQDGTVYVDSYYRDETHGYTVIQPIDAENGTLGEALSLQASCFCWGEGDLLYCSKADGIYLVDANHLPEVLTEEYLVMDYAASDTLSPVCFALWESTPGEKSFILAADGLAYLFEKTPVS